MRGSRNARGAAAIEFAIVLPLLLLIIFGTIEFGFLLYNKQVITNASREGARAGIVVRTPARLPDFGSPSVDQVVQLYCAQNLISFDTAMPPPVTSFPDGFNPNALFGENLRVRVAYNYQFLIFPDIVIAFFRNTPQRQVTLVAETVMRYE
ncbi:MAG TPA: pilus assembly protein [Syntrophales bacterium]|nr:pilus assembly protein [Syntrophales bacterium]HOX93683.1 pilus assembly protein [Syntrophales bacterium]HPI56579.1 pilus assembly protein [Syntrophales bacterium]HPN25000.1 pilus assembly protein [Syntrophales bacterium]HQM29258.1 pilus assembly protein [Syntrophales bacterium]